MARPFAPGTPAPSALGLGTAGFAEDRADEAHRQLDAFVALGGTLIDTAARYGFGASERIIGEWLRASGARDSVVLLTKCSHPDAAWTTRLDAASIHGDLDESLGRLGVDHVDVLMVHRDDEALPVEPIVDALQEEVARGRTRAIGVSNWRISRVARALAHAASTGGAPIAASSVYLGLATPGRTIHPGAVDACDDASLAWYAAHDVSLLAWSSQSSGFFEPGWDPSAQPFLSAYDTPANRARRDRATELGKRLGATATQVAIAWVLAQACRPIALGGFRTLDALRDAWAATELDLTIEQCHWLETGATLD